jgi:hypothetical protein
MQTRASEVKPAPPRLFYSFIAGFDTVANHITLILFPLALDLILWFGPHLSIKNLNQPFIQQVQNSSQLSSADASTLGQSIQTVWAFISDKYNLFSGLRTFPVGIPSLMSALAPTTNPLGIPLTLQVRSPLSGIGWYILIAFSGLVFGSWYFNSVAQAVLPEKVNLNLKFVGKNTLQVIILTFALMLLLLILTVPAFIFIPIFLKVSPAISQVLILIFLVIVIWFLIPLLFSPHGIFIYQQNALISILTSTKVIRSSMPGSITFFFLAMLLSQGMDLLWQVPPDNSWMALVGISGHAFVTTGILAASFIYYRDAIRWVQELIQSKILPNNGTQA